MFSVEDIFLTNNSEILEYQKDINPEKIQQKWGQMKLLTVEILFLTLKLRDIIDPILLYIGAGSGGDHISILSYLFPYLQFHLYDDKEFRGGVEEYKNMFKYPEKVHIHTKLFLEEDIREWAGISAAENNVFLISDIRTTDKNMCKTNVKCIYKDTKLQEKIVRGVNPIESLLKFTLPYFDKDNDENIKYYKRKQLHLDGYILFQPFTASRATETRLIPFKQDGVYRKRQYDIKDYEDRLYYHNKIRREINIYKDPITGSYDIYDIESQIDNSYDFMYYTFVLNKYCELVREDEDIEERKKLIQVKTLSNFILNKLNSFTGKNITFDMIRSKIRYENF